METKPELNVVNNETLCVSKKVKIEEDKHINIMDIIEKEDKELLANNRIANMERIDWGKTMAVSNQYIQRNILRSKLEPFGYSVYSTDDADMPKINIANNSPGFDLVIVTPEKKLHEFKVNLDKLTEKVIVRNKHILRLQEDMVKKIKIKITQDMYVIHWMSLI